MSNAQHVPGQPTLDGTAERACYVDIVAGTLPCAVRRHDAYADNQFPDAKNDDLAR